MADEIDREDLRAIILALLRIEEKLGELLGEDDKDDAEEEDLSSDARSLAEVTREVRALIELLQAKLDRPERS